MRYIGNKSKMLENIETVITKYNITGTTFADLFAGTSTVGDYFKDKYTIISNDFMYYSYVLSMAKLSFDKKPSFKNFKSKYNLDIYDWLNNKKYLPDSSYFFYENYSPRANRMFFTEDNAIKIDGIRQEIEKLYSLKIIDDNEYYFLIASMIESITKVANTSGTFEAYFKFWESRAEKEFNLEPLIFNEKKRFSDNFVYCDDTNELVRKIDGDIAYIDTPYTVTQYVSAYHMFETIAKYDYPKITGVGGKRNRENKNSLYARRNEALNQFEDLFRQLKFKHIIISYSNQGLVPLNDLVELAKLFAKNNQVFVEKFDYQEYQNHRSSNKRNGGKLNEIIIYFEKDCSINKSPLNYSGSKDKLLPILIPELPYHIECFVDAMGGAFNVGTNIIATKKTIYNEINQQVFNIIKELVSSDKNELISKIEEYINKFQLSKGNKTSFDKLKRYYNSNKNDYIALYVLHMYSFQNLIRFNSKQEFNTPIGVAGYSSDIKKRIISFVCKSPELNLMNKDFLKLDILSFPRDTLFYFDPPYLITTAGYNDGKRGGNGWSVNEEKKLLEFLDKVHLNGYKFILSNVIEHNGKVNTLLKEWAEKNNFTIKKIGISGWRYSKNEVIIKNY